MVSSIPVLATLSCCNSGLSTVSFHGRSPSPSISKDNFFVIDFLGNCRGFQAPSPRASCCMAANYARCRGHSSKTKIKNKKNDESLTIPHSLSSPIQSVRLFVRSHGQIIYCLWLYLSNTIIHCFAHPNKVCRSVVYRP